MPIKNESQYDSLKELRKDIQHALAVQLWWYAIH
jgi:hypothetical protein